MSTIVARPPWRGRQLMAREEFEKLGYRDEAAPTGTGPTPAEPARTTAEPRERARRGFVAGLRDEARR